MATGTMIPVEISTEAQQHIAQLGLVREFEEMIEHVKQTMPGTQKIDVRLDVWPEEPGDLGIVIMPHRSHPGGDDSTDREWIAWIVDTYTPDVLRHFSLISAYSDSDNC
jgi:hypothetical protein